MHKKAGWVQDMSPGERLNFFGLILVGISLVAIVIGILWAKGDSNERLKRLEIQWAEQSAEIFINRAVSCRTLVSLDVRLTQGGPCYHPEVIKHFDPNDPNRIPG